MKYVKDKKKNIYLGEIFKRNMKTYKNIQEKTNKVYKNIRKFGKTH